MEIITYAWERIQRQRKKREADLKAAYAEGFEAGRAKERESKRVDGGGDRPV